MLDYPTVRKKNITRWCELSSREWEERTALKLSQELKTMGFEKEVFL